MKYETVEIVLIQSFASDAMIRVVLIFPEVFQMDVTCSTNQQNRLLFLMVVKDVNRQMHDGNINILPSEKEWVFNKIIRTIFILLYGEDMIKRNQLILTDEDSTEYEPVVNAIKTIDTYAKSSHMQCVLHALTKKSKKQYTQLWHTNMRKKISFRLVSNMVSFWILFFVFL